MQGETNKQKQGCDVGNCSDDSSVMADKRSASGRGNYCVVSGPNKSIVGQNKYIDSIDTLSTQKLSFAAELELVFTNSRRKMMSHVSASSTF